MRVLFIGFGVRKLVNGILKRFLLIRILGEVILEYVRGGMFVLFLG